MRMCSKSANNISARGHQAGVDWTDRVQKYENFSRSEIEIYMTSFEIVKF